MPYSIAIDVGTTNIQASLVDTKKHKRIDCLSALNSQIFHGEDIISRLKFSLKSEEFRKIIRKRLVSDISLIISAMLKRNNISYKEIEKVFACGNSAMQHILLELPLEGLARAPFRPSHAGKIYSAYLSTIGIRVYENTLPIPFVFLPNLGGFVGSDALCVIFETGLYKEKKATLAIDLGTNGEIILGNRYKIFVASTSAGPSFSEWHIKCRLRGSTLIDVMAGLLKKGVIDKSGRMMDDGVKINVGNKPILITKKDVRQFQLAKAAISTAVKILKDNFPAETIGKTYITGLFGSKVSGSNAKLIGLLPHDINFNAIKSSRNLALQGLEKLLFIKNLQKQISPIIKLIEHVELHKKPNFQESFASSISF